MLTRRPAIDVHQASRGLLLVPSKREGTVIACRLSNSGKAKVRRFVREASSAEELADVEAALDTGQVSKQLVVRLRLHESDFEPVAAAAASAEQVPAASHAPAAQVAVPDVAPTAQTPGSEATPPLAALGLTAAGLAKVRKSIEEASDMELLAKLDKALTQGDIPLLRQLLNLQLDDLVQSDDESQEGDAASVGIASTVEGDEAASVVLSELGSDVNADEEEYDPFATEPVGQQSPEQPAPLEAMAMPTPEVVPAVEPGEAKDATQLPAPEEHATVKPVRKRPRKIASTSGPLGVLQSAYEDSDAEEEKSDDASPAALELTADSSTPTEKRARACAKGRVAKEEEPETKKLAWPIAWAWIVSRTHRHPDFRAPGLLPDTRRAVEQGPDGAAVDPRAPLAVALSVSRVYVGSAAYGYDPHHLARVAIVDNFGKVRLDALCRPRAPLLDCRTHLTGLTREQLNGESAMDYDSVRTRVLEILRPEMLLVGYRLNGDLAALGLWHGPLVDVSLLFAVETRKQHQYHPLWYLAERMLQMEFDETEPHDALESARLIMRLAQHEAQQNLPTAPFVPKEFSGCELVVRHIPYEWGTGAAKRVVSLCRGAQQTAVVNWLLSESDPSEWRGDSLLTFPSVATRDAAFDALRALTDVHVQWEDLPGAPPLGAFITEQSLIQAFSSFGVVVAARIPRKPTTREPQQFAFISFLEREDATKVAKKPHIEVQLTPTWSLTLKPRLAKFGNSTDKRVPVKAGTREDSDYVFDWVHVSKR